MQASAISVAGVEAARVSNHARRDEALWGLAVVDLEQGCDDAYRRGGQGQARSALVLRHTFIPDESFIQSIVSNSHLADRVVSDDLRLIIWDRPTPPYPATLTIQDLDLLLASEKLFARKFHPGTDEAILDALDDRNGREETRLRSGTALS